MAHQHVQLNNNNNVNGNVNNNNNNNNNINNVNVNGNVNDVNVNVNSNINNINQHEFLPLCDVLFNIISLASYFCDVVFDLAMGYALANHPTAPAVLFPISIVLVVTSLIISQVVSIRWYLWGARGKLNPTESLPEKNRVRNWILWCVVFLHTSQIGVLWRYFKLFIPVDLTYVKHEVRELCVLRLIHAFCEAAPMLLLQLYLLSTSLTSKDRDREDTKLSELTAVSAGLSLWSVCWAVASFSKGAARLRNLERLVLTWLGVLAQLAWRLGTVSARVGALVAYASLYGGSWLLVVLGLHWLSMLTWLLLTPDGLFHGGERLTLARKTFLACLLAFVYVFAYVNLHETNHRQKMIIFYTVMFLENCLLISVWAVGASAEIGRQVQIGAANPDQVQIRPVTLVLVLMALFFGGLFFMGLYYRFFHVRRLGYEAGGRMNANGMPQDVDKHLQYNNYVNEVQVRPLHEEEEEKEQAKIQIGTLNVHLIREKLREKKQQQLRELRAIQEEIKEGKLVPPGETSETAITGNPPPQKKLQPTANTLQFAGLGSGALSPTGSGSNVPGLENVPSQWPPIKMHCLVPPAPPNYHVIGNDWKRERPETPEILLAPRCLPHHYPYWTSNHSDLEGSQVSLPRSYTLPREFKYHSGNPSRERRDVDSADNEDETDTELRDGIEGGKQYIFPDRQMSQSQIEDCLPSEGLNSPSGVISSIDDNFDCYLNNSYGSRVNQLLKAKVKHETKL
ncbi:Similar to XKR6: XK-related protein 6 (Homo sapiens) [Cotesia congregata]|uniref:XK-related protein n=1 Tax=Cotesia congregata TaxID=51543 RepID=A0A8J2HBP4_COTCN|nr:Similar to XKR6: XK-related protein 6 (Homo sapiens) [Cotesia congregata]